MTQDYLLTILRREGPCRSSKLAEFLKRDFGLSAEAARKRLSRISAPIRAYPIPLLPKREKFLYEESSRGGKQYWANFHAALRESESVYGLAIDGLIAKGGIISADEFPVISGAPIKQQKHIPASLVLKNLLEAGFVAQWDSDEGKEIRIARPELGSADFSTHRARRIVEAITLDGVREWARKLGIASYNKIAIRGEAHLRQVGPYMWDLTGPSYLLPLRVGKPGQDQGFFVADALMGSTLNEHQIKYFIRKTQALKATTNVGRILPMIIADGFTPEALKQGHQAGLILTTPSTLFGKRVGQSIANLFDALKNAVGIATGNPSKLFVLLDRLSEIEGSAGNLRGLFFELIVAYLLRNDGYVKMNRKVEDAEGKKAEIDILITRGEEYAAAYECKGRSPEGRVTKEEVEDWLKRLPIFKYHLHSRYNVDNSNIRFELWTSGTFNDDALELLEHNKKIRSTTPIDWKDGKTIREKCVADCEPSILNALDQHYLNYALNKKK